MSRDDLMREDSEALVLAPTRPPPNTTVDDGLAFELSMSDLGEVPRPEGEWAEGVAFVLCLGIRFLVFVPLLFYNGKARIRTLRSDTEHTTPFSSAADCFSRILNK